MKNWKNTGKRSLSAFLALVMCLSMVCTTAFAEGEGEGAGTGPAVCTKADDCAAETHEAGCPKYVAPEETEACETCGQDPCVCEEEEEQDGDGDTAALDEFNAAVDAMGDATDMESTLAALNAIETAYAALSDDEKASVAEQWAYIQGYAEQVRAGNPDEDLDTLEDTEQTGTENAMGYKGDTLPEGPDMSGTTVTVIPENAQYTLDGAYGSIDGKTIHFSAGTYEALELGRTTKYAGSGTKYYRGGNTTATELEIGAVAGTGTYTYVRTMSNVTFTADEGAALTGFYGSSGHHYGNDYDYVRDTGTVSTTTGYYVWWTMKNITFDGLTVNGKFNFACSGTQTDVDGITFQNCTFTGTGTTSTVGAAIRMQTDLADCYKNVTVSNCKFTNYYQGVYVQGPDNMTVQGCEFTTLGHNAIGAQSGGSNTVRGNIVLSGNTFTNVSDRAIRFGNIGEGAAITVERNTAVNSGDKDGEIMKAGTIASSASITIAENNSWGEGKKVNEAMLPVAEVGGKYYNSLQGAITAVYYSDSKKDTVKLLKAAPSTDVGYVCIWEGCDITLDMGGNELSDTVWNYGTLTITGNGTFKKDVNNSNNGTMTIENGNFNAYEWTLPDGSWNGPPALYNWRGEVTVKGGTFTTPNGCGANTIINEDKMTIEDGTIQNLNPQPSEHTCIATQDPVDEEGKPTGEKGDLTIKGGDFNGKIQHWTFTAPKITGGTFSYDVTQYCAPGLVATAGDDGKYTVGIDPKGNFVAQVVGGGAYEKLADAIKDCPAGGTVKVLADVTLTESINPGKAITIEGVTKKDGSKPVISGDKGLFSVTEASATLKNLELQATDNTWYIYQESNSLTVDGCDFTMAEGVSDVGNLIMDDGHGKVTFTNNKVLAHSRVALAGPGNDSVITNNVFDLVNEAYGTSRTSVIGLTATANTSNIIITGNTFKNANRVLGVDNSPNMPADKLTFNQNKIIDCRYALEVSPEKNVSQKFNIDYNYSKFNDEAPRAPRVENADASGSHTDGFATELTELGTLVTNNVHYTTEALSRSLSVANASVQVGNTVQLTATSSTLSGPVTWSSGDTGVATVSATGVVTGVTAGTVTITALMGDTSATCTVTVSQRSTTPTNPGGNTGTGGGGSSSSGGGGYRPSGGGSSSGGGGTVNIQDPDVPLADLPLVFTDVEPDAYYVNAVKWAVQEKITSGTSSTTFSPNATCTRAQMVTFLWRAAGSPAPKSGTNPFTDVVSGAYYYDAVLWAVEQGITSGTSKTTFSPDAKVTRGQSVTFLYRAAGSPAVNDGKSFDDVDSSAFYAKAVRWAADKGVTSGTTKTTFSPGNNCTRAQIVSFLYRDRVS